MQEEKKIIELNNNYKNNLQNRSRSSVKVLHI